MLVDVRHIAKFAAEHDGEGPGAPGVPASPTPPSRTGVAPDPTGVGLLPRIAEGIAYSRDPKPAGRSAEVFALSEPVGGMARSPMLALGRRESGLHGPHGQTRHCGLRNVRRRLYDLGRRERRFGENLVAVPALSPSARTGIFKVCRQEDRRIRGIVGRGRQRFANAGRHAMALGGLSGGPLRLRRTEVRLHDFREEWSPESRNRKSAGSGTRRPGGARRRDERRTSASIHAADGHANRKGTCSHDEPGRIHPERKRRFPSRWRRRVHSRRSVA